MEYPKCLYKSLADTVTVHTIEEEQRVADNGYLTAAQFYQYETPASSADLSDEIGTPAEKKKARRTV